MRPTRTREKKMNEFNDDLFGYIDSQGQIIEFSIRELLAYQFDTFKFPFTVQGYTKQEKIDFMKGIIADIEKCIEMIEKDENAKSSEV